MEYLFLFEMIEKGSNIIIYGMGNVGKSYIKQIEETRWCNILGVSDQKKYSGRYVYFKIEELKTIKNIDYIVIALRSPIIASQIYNQLLFFGIPKSILLNENMRYNNFPLEALQIGKCENIQIAVVEGGGFGDSLIDMILINKICELLENKCIITFFNKYENYFSIFPKINNSINFKLYSNSYDQKYDLVIHMHNIPIIHYINHERVKQYSEKLYYYCVDNMYYFDILFSRNTNNYRFTKYALLLGKNRIEQLDLHDLLDITRKDKVNIPIVKENINCLKKYRLYREKYITVNRDVGNEERSHPKLWPVQYYKELLLFIKNKYSEYKIVLVGQECNKELSHYSDIDLTGKLSLIEVNSILKYGYLHIGTEGGMVHLKHFLNGKSMVFFGPTDPDVFGYKENINVYNNVCKDCCEWLTDNWDKSCILNPKKPKCIYSIKPDIVENLLNNQMQEERNKKFSLKPIDEKVYSKIITRCELSKYNLPYESNGCEIIIELYLRAEDDVFYILYEATRILERRGKLIINKQQEIPQEILQSLSIYQDKDERNSYKYILTRED